MTEQEEIKKHNISIREMPMGLWREFRSYCIRRSMNVDDAVIEALNQYLESKLKEEASHVS